MKLIRSLNNLKLTEPLCLTIGNFDGFHLGHQKIISNIKSLCAKHNYKSAILTFEPHPYSFFKKENNKKFRISSLSQKLQYIKDSNIDYAIILPFNSNLSQISANNFINEILVNKLNTKHIIIGYDFVFGKNRSGNINTLIDNSLNRYIVKQINVINKNNEICSSSNIRENIISGKIDIANNLLNKYFTINSRIISGQKIARNIGYKTANFIVPLNIIKPKYGVYHTKTFIYKLNKEYNSITNFGIKPTINNICHELCETHIPNFDSDIYNCKISTKFIKFIREEKKFNNIEELKEQISRDLSYI